MFFKTGDLKVSEEKSLNYYYQIFIKNVIASLSIIAISYVATFLIFLFSLCIPFVGWVIIPVIVWYWGISLNLGVLMLILGLIVDFYWVLVLDSKGEPPVTKYLNIQRHKTQNMVDRVKSYKPGA